MLHGVSGAEEIMLEKVQILLSTYNGERFLREQLQSLLNQTYPNLEILIRDDGSLDSTALILQEYADNYSNIHVYLEENVGAVNSFFKLLSRCDADYAAFCDQDDVWFPEKIERAVEKLRKVKGPGLYCSNKILVDSNLQIISDNKGQKLKPGFGNAVVESICTGCTALLNRDLVLDIQKHIPQNAIIHDWWCYLAASYTGKVVFDERAFIWYRQHEHNVIGAGVGFWNVVKAKAGYLKKSRGKLKLQLAEFGAVYHSNRKKDKLVQLLLRTGKFRGKLSAFFCRSYYRQSKLDGLITRVLILFNYL